MDDFWLGLTLGEPRFREVSLFPTESLPYHLAAEIGPWTPGHARLDGDRVAVSRVAEFALAALDEALADAGAAGVHPERILVGTTVGDVSDREQRLRTVMGAGGALGDASGVDETLRSTLSAHLGGAVPTELFVTACAAGNLAVIRGAQLIAAGSADLVVCGGAEALSRLAFLGFSRMRGMARQGCRPFDSARDGMLLGEGAAFLVLEAAEHARARGAAVRATIPGYGITCDARHPTSPDPTGDGVARAMRSALAGTRPCEVTYVSAHGTGTQQNDAAEAAAYRQVFTDRRPPISSIKALIGHALGAASAIEAVACVLAIDHQRLIPQWGVDQAAAVPGVHLVDPQVDTATSIEFVLNNAFAFGGNNTCVGFRSPRLAERSVA